MGWCSELCLFVPVPGTIQKQSEIVLLPCPLTRTGKGSRGMSYSNKLSRCQGKAAALPINTKMRCPPATSSMLTCSHHPIVVQHFKAIVANYVEVLRALLLQHGPLQLELWTGLVHLFGFQPGLVPWFVICDCLRFVSVPVFLSLFAF